MKLYIGIDLGTSAMKLLLMDAEGTIHNVVTKVRRSRMWVTASPPVT